MRASVVRGATVGVALTAMDDAETSFLGLFLSGLWAVAAGSISFADVFGEEQHL